MLASRFLPSYIMGAVVALYASPVYANALQPTQVANLAKGTVVRIEPKLSGPGSGVIIGRYQERGTNVYVVLTAAHVVAYEDDIYQVITPRPMQGNLSSRKRREKIRISYNNIQKLPGLDLAIVKFQSDRLYEKAILGDSNYTTEGAGVYIAGFPNPGQTIRKRIFQFTASLVSSRLDDEEMMVEGEEDPGVLSDGYALVYTNVTRAGMSGGPIFDVAGRVVGIHGMGDGDKIAGISDEGFSSSETGPVTSYVKTGFNLGIPISSFLQAMSHSVNNLGIKIDRSEPGILPGGGLIALRGGNNNSEQKNSHSDIKLIEEETMDEDIVVDQTQPIANLESPTNQREDSQTTNSDEPNSVNPSNSNWGNSSGNSNSPIPTNPTPSTPNPPNTPFF